jgi:transcriptional regulator with XRE-family HTH domain
MVTRIEAKGVRPLTLYFKQWRKSAKLTQEQLAELLNVSAATVSRIENGKRDYTGKYLTAFVHFIRCPLPGDPLNRTPDDISIDSRIARIKDPEKRRRIAARAAELMQILEDASDI